jgi:hypothetical protein
MPSLFASLLSLSCSLVVPLVGLAVLGGSIHLALIVPCSNTFVKCLFRISILDDCSAVNRRSIVDASRIDFAPSLRPRLSSIGSALYRRSGGVLGALLGVQCIGVQAFLYRAFKRSYIGVQAFIYRAFKRSYIGRSSVPISGATHRVFNASGVQRIGCSTHRAQRIGRNASGATILPPHADHRPARSLDLHGAGQGRGWESHARRPARSLDLHGARLRDVKANVT